MLHLFICLFATNQFLRLQIKFLDLAWVSWWKAEHQCPVTTPTSPAPTSSATPDSVPWQASYTQHVWPILCGVVGRRGDGSGQSKVEQMLWKIPEKLLSLLDPSSALRPVQSHVMDKQTLQKSLYFQAWNKHIGQSPHDEDGQNFAKGGCEGSC